MLSYITYMDEIFTLRQVLTIFFGNFCYAGIKIDGLLNVEVLQMKFTLAFAYNYNVKTKRNGKKQLEIFLDTVILKFAI